MEIRQIKELMASMGRTGTQKLSLKKEGFELTLERAENGYYRAVEPDLSEEPLVRMGPSIHHAALPLPKGKDGVMIPQGEKEEEGGLYVTSPMVGTFYAASSPEDAPFVKPGDKIEKQTIVCIIEAMKVMNEIKANLSGTVVEVLVENGQAVEFGTKLFRVG